jgi:hypothetical protein
MPSITPTTTTAPPHPSTLSATAPMNSITSKRLKVDLLDEKVRVAGSIRVAAVSLPRREARKAAGRRYRDEMGAEGTGLVRRMYEKAIGIKGIFEYMVREY